MQHRWLTLFSIGFLAVIVFALFFLRLQPVRPRFAQTAQPTETAVTTEPSVHVRNPAKGAKEPRVTLVEFGDFQCMPCKDMAESIDVLLRTIPEVRMVWKNMPNESAHPLATPTAIAAHCAADQGKFWDYHDALYAQQATLSESLFPSLAKELGLDMKRFEQCYANRDPLPLIKKDFEEALALQLSATPTIFIGEERIVGLASAEELITAVRQVLASQPAL
ncbi:thioredoxin domain-containing protein [Candidatus Uhrbacteria bacterium]|nr:thioredoxin domain-containing protein [Candidatus Uhrbacteria bacterium]